VERQVNRKVQEAEKDQRREMLLLQQRMVGDVADYDNHCTLFHVDAFHPSICCTYCIETTHTYAVNRIKQATHRPSDTCRERIVSTVAEGVVVML
jgi:hypothetical protein